MSQVTIRTAAPVPVARLLNPVGMWRNLAGHRDLIRQFVVREIRQRHRGTNLDMIWAVVNPLLILVVYTLVFSGILNISFDRLKGISGHIGFALNLFCGIIVFTFFTECVTAAPMMIVNKPNFVKRVVFPTEILPLASVGAAIFFAGVSVIILLVAGGLLGVWSPTLWLFPVVLVPLVLMTLGLSWFLASLGVFVRDVQPMVMIVVGRLLFFLTPIFYSLDNVHGKARVVLLLNPMTTIVTNARKTLLWGERPDWAALGAVTAISVVVFVLGYAWFMKSKRGFADVL